MTSASVANRLTSWFAFMAVFATAALDCNNSLAGETPPQFLWAQALDSSTDVLPGGFALDAFGNSYCTGTYRDELRIGTFVLTNGGIFIAKVDRTGRTLWARRDGSPYSEGKAIGIDGAGNVYVVCDLRLPPSPVPIAGTNLMGQLVVAKYTGNGEALWARPVGSGGSQLDVVSSLAVESSGANYWSVFYRGTVTLGNTNISSAGYIGAFLKCDPEGNVVWVKSPPAGDFTLPADPQLDPSGNLYVCGRFSNTIDLGATNLTSAGSSDILITKWTPGGQLLWARQAGGAEGDWSQRLDIDAGGNCIVSGTVTLPATFSQLTISTNPPGQYSFISRYSPQGDLIWVRTVAAGPAQTLVTTDCSLNCYVAAQYLATNTVYAKYDAAGDLQWAKIAPHWLHLFRMRADAMGHCYLYGFFHVPSVAFDGTTLFRTNFNENTFLARLDTTTLPRLSISSSGGNVHVSWSALASGYHVESSLTPFDPQTWVSNSTLPSSSGLTNTVSSPISDKLFYRLRRGQ